MEDLRVPDWRLEGWGHLWHHRSCQQMIGKISWKFDEDPTWFRSGLHLGLGGHWRFLTGDLKDEVIFDIMDCVDWLLRRYYKVWWRSDKIWLIKKFVLGMGGGVWRLGWLVFVKYMDQFKPINSKNIKTVTISFCVCQAKLVKFTKKVFLTIDAQTRLIE